LLQPFKFQADFSPTVLYIECETDPAVVPHYRRTVWIAGLPDVSDQTTDLLPTDPLVLAALKVFIGDLEGVGRGLGANNNISIRSIDQSGANPVKNCTAWNPIPNTYTVPAHGMFPNQPVIAEGMRTIKGGICPRGRYLIDATPDANTISLQGSSPPTAPIKFGGFRPAIFTFNAVTAATMQGFTKRNKGRPSFLSVGRRRSPATKRA
jgi:hypothetical protein